MADGAERIARLSDAKRQLLAKQLASGRINAFPLSYGQERLWFLDCLTPGTSAYNLAVALDVHERPDVPALTRAFREIVARHEVLRTTFLAPDGSPFQVVVAATNVPIRIERASRSRAPFTSDEVRAVLVADAQQAFDLTVAPLLRVTVVVLGDDHFVLQITLHHIVCDEWSFRILLREVLALYRAHASGRTVQLPPLAMQYGDFAVWQRARLTEGRLEPALAHWASRLSGVSMLDVPSDHARPPLQTFHGATRRFRVPATLTEQLRILGRREGATLFMTLLAGFKTLLHRYTGLDDIVVGTPVTGRTRSELEPLVGFFVNMLVLRSDVSGDPSFRELLERVRLTCLDAYAHQEVPFEKIVERMRPARDLARHPLFQTCFALQSTRRIASNLDPTMTLLSPETETARFDLELYLDEDGDELDGTCIYNADIFEAATIDRLLDHYTVLLDGVAVDADAPVSSLPLLTAAERERIVVDWNRTAAPRPTPLLLHELFKAHVARAPHATAIRFEGRDLTYAEVDARATRLATHLRACGVEPDHAVAVLLERSPELLVTLLGVTMAGGAYVALEPECPDARAAAMLADTDARVVVTTAALRPRLEKLAVDVVDLDQEATWPSTPVRPPPTLRDDHLAYVMFTSGSSGTPKGVMLPHAAVCNRLLWAQETYPLTPADRVLHKTPFGFDVSVWEMFWPLLAGASVVVAQPGGHRDPRYLVDLVAREGVTVAHFIPSMLRLFLEQDEARECTTLRQLFCSGEELPLDVAQLAFRTLRASVHNLYGPTEAAIDATAWQCTPDEPGPRVPIGRPIANMQAYIVDRHLNPVPSLASGELCLAGIGLARGYAKQPRLTAERFVPNPFDATPGARLYRTGDLARYRADGAIEFLGRLDRQVKIRGMRVEPGEIEAALRRHPDVEECVVLALGGAASEPRLRAHVVARSGATLTTPMLREALSATLPAYMIPSSFVGMAALPRTSNGKLDIALLLGEPDDAPDDPRSTTDPIEALSPLEARLTALCAQVLGRRVVDVRQSFFDLGGTSLDAARFTARLSAGLRLEVTVRQLFEHPTMADLARSIDAGQRADAPLRPPAATHPTHRDADHISREPRPLLSLIGTGALSRVDAAALCCLPDAVFDGPSGVAARFADEWSQGLPVIAAVLETSVGTCAIILLPVLESAALGDPSGLERMVRNGAQLAGTVGARVVSLTGLIASGTDYGRAVETSGATQVSTGHTTTAAAVVVSSENLLAATGRRLSEEHLGVLGLGSIGTSALRLLLATSPHPKAITLCDVRGKRDQLRALARCLSDDDGFRGAIEIVESSPNPAPAFYRATAIIGAASLPRVLDVGRLVPGSLLVDDSYPHCFDPIAAAQRLAQKADILFTAGGIVRAPAPIRCLVHAPAGADAIIQQLFGEAFLHRDPHAISGCVLSSLLSASCDDLPPVLGLPRPTACRAHHAALHAMGFRAAPPHCLGRRLDERSVARFVARYGGRPPQAP